MLAASVYSWSTALGSDRRRVFTALERLDEGLRLGVLVVEGERLPGRYRILGRGLLGGPRAWPLVAVRAGRRRREVVGGLVLGATERVARDQLGHRRRGA